MRLLLVHGEYKKAWKIAGFEKSPKILSPVQENISLLNRDKISFYQSGGAHSNGIEIEDLVIYDDIIDVKEIKKNQTTEKEVLYIDKFTSAVCMIINGVNISRIDLIKYIANKSGGAHFDPKLKDEVQEALSELDIEVTNRSAIYLEMLSIGQLLKNSRDTDRFLKKVKDLGII